MKNLGRRKKSDQLARPSSRPSPLLSCALRPPPPPPPAMSNADEVVGRHAASGFSEIGRRELGFSGSRAFTRRVGGSEGLVRRMNQYGKLRGHDGCVNTVSFNPTGDLLVSGSDDMDIILWDWFAKTKKLVYPSGHEGNVFHACMLPFRDDCTIVTAAADGQVRVGQLKEGGEVTTKQIGTHDDRVHKLALEPGSPHIFYSCGEDGLVQHIMAANKRGREVETSQSAVPLTSEVIMHVMY